MAFASRNGRAKAEGLDHLEALVRASGQLRLGERWRSGQAGAEGLSSAEASLGSCCA